MVIDALRLDLIIDKTNFLFVHELLLKNEACMLQMKVNLPTVTKPRITALTSGKLELFCYLINVSELVPYKHK